MQDREKKEFSDLLTDAMAFYKQDVSKFAMSVWWEACKKYDLDQVRSALTRHAMDAERGVYPPKPADMVRMLEGTATDRAVMAWGKALEAAQRVGAYTDVVFDDPAIHAAIEDLGGWPKFCRGETKDLSFLQHRFCEFHRAYTNSGQFDYPRVLSGDRSPDEMYAMKGLKPPKPAVIGNVETARIVWQGGQIGGKTQINFHGLMNKTLAALENGAAR